MTPALDTKKMFSMLDLPSVTQQTKWPCGLFSFGKAQVPGTDYFNCGIVERPDGRWLIVRRAKFKDALDLGMNDIMAFKLDGLTPLFGVKVQMGQQFEIEHFEDPRAYYHDGRTFISCCNFIRNNKGCTYPHQIICEVTNDWKLIKRHDPVYGHNGPRTEKNTLHEKNWLWFFKEKEMWLVYESAPHTVVPWWEFFGLNTFNVGEKEFKTEWDSSLWKYGHIRGGSPPVLHNGEYWTFFHSSVDVPLYRRQYHMGCYAFEAKPPFRITKITLEPLLTGSRFDPWGNGKPLVVFPCGSLLTKNEWLVTLGVNDMACGHITIPHKDLEEVMIEL